MKIKDIDLSSLTSIKQEGRVQINLIENEHDIGYVDLNYLIGAGSNVLIKSKRAIFKLSDNYSYIKKKIIF